MTIYIKQTLRRDSAANPKDVLAIKKALALTGHYEVPDYGLTPYPDQKLFDAIKNYQKSAGLKVDGVITPKGETIVSLIKDMGIDYEDDGYNEEDKDPYARTPTIWCPECGGPHGGSKGELCPDCDSKQQ